jgi:two-component sensor histidine kinase
MAASVSDARHEVAAYLARRMDVRSSDIEVAVTEAVSNAVGHAFSEDRAGSIWVGIDLLVPDTLVISVSDDGIGMGPDFGHEGLGLGLSLIGRLATDFEVREAEPHGTMVEMRFRLTGEGRLLR